MFSPSDYSEEIVVFYREEPVGFVTIYLNEEVFVKITNEILLINFILLVIVFSILVIFSYLLYKKELKPLQDLKKSAYNLEKGNFGYKVNIKTNDEFEELGEALNRSMASLAKMDQEHKQLDEAKTRFISITSHELRSPMTPLKAQLQMLGGEYFGKTNQKQKEAIQLLTRNADRLDKIIVDFLEVSRIEAARLKFVFKRVSLTKSITELLKFMQGFMPEKKVKIVGHIDKLPIMEVDPDRVDQVLRNLINNAIKFSPKSGVVEVTAKRKANYILFAVRDQGIGMKSKDQQRIFEPFYQAEQTIYRKRGGTGLGLAICRGIVEAQKGRIWLESKVGKGTTFYFTIPLEPVKKIKAIKLLFSSSEVTDEKIKELFLEILGPMGTQEFERIKKRGINTNSLLNYSEKMKKLGVINEEKAQQMKFMVKKLLQVKEKPKKIDVNFEIKKLYLELLGPIGKKRFNRIKKVNTKTIVSDVNYLEKKNVLNAKEASSLRDKVVALFIKKEFNDMSLYALGEPNEITSPKDYFSIFKSQQKKLKEKDLEQFIKEKKIKINYNRLIKELIRKTYALYGKIASEKANSISGIKVGLDGTVLKIGDNPELILKKLVSLYSDLTGELDKFIKEKELIKLLDKNKKEKHAEKYKDKSNDKYA